MKRAFLKMRDIVLDRVRVHASYRRVFDNKDGEVVLRHILKVGLVTRPTFVAGDPHMTSLNEGKRQLALSILRFARKDHDEVLRQVEQSIDDE